MWSQILVMLAVVALFVWWSRTPRGHAAWALLASSRDVFVVALLLWGLAWVLGEADLGPLDESILSLPSVGIHVTGSVLLLLAAHLVASALVVARLARASGMEGARWTRLFPGLALGQAAIWVPMIALLWLLSELQITSVAGFLAIVALMALALVTLNVLLARLVARLVRSEGRLSPAFERLWRRDPERDQTVLVPVLIRFLMTGAITLILIVAHTTGDEHGTTVRTVYRANLDVQTVASVTCENMWPRQIAASIHAEAPTLLVRGVGLLSALASLVFLAAFVRGSGNPAGVRNSGAGPRSDRPQPTPSSVRDGRR